MNKKSDMKHSNYFDTIAFFENECESVTIHSYLKESDVFIELGKIMRILYGVACCQWGCHHKEHVFEYLSGRTTTSANSSIRLIGYGYYDESLNINRSIAEIGNLMQLFIMDGNHIRLWLDLPDKERQKKYSAVSVRFELEKIGSVVPTDKDSYTWLCEVGAHITPRTKPQAHNSLGRPILGNVYQPDGVETALNSLAWSVCTVAGPLAKLAIIPRKTGEQLLNSTISLAKILFSKPDAPLRISKK